MKGTRLLVLLLVGLVVLDLSWTAAVNHRAASTEERIEQVERDQEALGTYYGMNDSLSDDTAATVSLYAYDTGRGDGVAVPARVVSVPADGLYMDVSDVAQSAALQRTTKRSWAVAMERDPTPAHRGAMVSIDAPDAWDTVGGGSAALSLATAFAATNPCASVNESVAATGGLSGSGTIVQVEYVEEKVEVAKQRGIDLVVVPSGQSVDVSGVTVVETATFTEASEYTLDVDESCQSAPTPAA